ncbi:MAG: ROK family protein, partial [bacterium]
MASRDGLVLGIDLGGTDCKFGVVDSKGRVIRKARHRTQNENGPEQALALIAAHAREILGSDSMSGVGMGVPGPMSSREGIVFQAPNL